MFPQIPISALTRHIIDMKWYPALKETLAFFNLQVNRTCTSCIQYTHGGKSTCTNFTHLPCVNTSLLKPMVGTIFLDLAWKCQVAYVHQSGGTCAMWYTCSYSLIQVLADLWAWFCHCCPVRRKELSPLCSWVLAMSPSCLKSPW